MFRVDTDLLMDNPEWVPRENLVRDRKCMARDSTAHRTGRMKAHRDREAGTEVKVRVCRDRDTALRTGKTKACRVTGTEVPRVCMARVTGVEDLKAGRARVREIGVVLKTGKVH